MAIMIPNALSPDIKSAAEKHIFDWFQNAPGTENWIILHSLGISTHQRVIHGETDFLVLAPERGMFALEVKGGRVQRKLGKWRFINKYGEVSEKVRGPFDQAWEGIYSIKASLENKLDAEHEHLKYMIFGIGVMFPDIDFDSVGVDEEEWQIFDINDGKDVKSFIDRISDGAVKTRKRLEIPVSAQNYPTKEDVLYLADLLRGDFDKDVPLRIKQKYAEEGFTELTNEQSLCIEQLWDNSRALIRGTAGTGKTLLAVAATKVAISRGERVAVFCYNRQLGEWLKDSFSEFPLLERPAFVGTFHTFMKHMLSARGIESTEPSEPREKVNYYESTLPKMVLEYCAESRVQYDRIIVDEAQDLIQNGYLDVMDQCLRGGLTSGKWTMFGDVSMQAIYNRSLDEQAYLELLQQRAFFAIFRLTRNCRNTKKICTEIENILGVKEIAAFQDRIDTPYVNYLIYANQNDQLTKLIKVINELLSLNISRKDIVILSPRRRKDSVVNLLDGIKVQDYSIQNFADIRFSTIQGFKGLESLYVILTDVENYQDERLMYVGLSRARFSLTVLETQKASDERGKLFFERMVKNVR